LRNFLAIGQVSMAVALCLGAGLLTRSYQNKMRFDPGFDTSHMVSVHTSLTRERYPEYPARGLYAEQVREQLLAVPGVAAVSFSSDRAVSRYPFPMGFRLEGEDAWRQGQTISLTVASPNHFELLNVPMVRGRPLEDTDQRGSPAVIVVNQSFASRYFSNEEAIGKRIRLDIEGIEEWPVIVGIVADRSNLGHTDNLGPEGYLSGRQFFPDWFSPVFLVQTIPSPSVLRDSIREAVQSVDTRVPVGRALPVDTEIEEAIRNNIATTRAVGVIAILGLIMAMVGIYGVVSYSVVERTYEMGVRMAMGASRRDLLQLILREGLCYAGIGLGVGLLLGGITSIGLRHMLFGIRHLDAATYSIVCLLLLGTALAACWLPARRAAMMDPMVALRGGG